MRAENLEKTGRYYLLSSHSHALFAYTNELVQEVTYQGKLHRSDPEAVNTGHIFSYADDKRVLIIWEGSEFQLLFTSKIEAYKHLKGIMKSRQDILESAIETLLKTEVA